MTQRLLIPLLLLATSAAAGDLAPPPGPVTPTMKPLSQIEPRIPIGPTTTPGDANSIYRITAPGAYYLTGDITGVAGKSGIEIGESNVSVDLGGFALLGDISIFNTLSGIEVTSSERGIVVRNGVVAYWSTGLGMDLAQYSQVLDVVSNQNLLVNIDLGNGGLVRGCTVNNGPGDGIRIAGGLVQGCSVASNGTGIRALGTGGLIEDCSLDLNGNGIVAERGYSIRGCTVSTSIAKAITVTAACVVADNACIDTGNFFTLDDTGILVLGTDNRIEGNQVVVGDRGIDIDVAGNFVVRNTVSGCTAAYLVTGVQTIGPIVSATGTIASTNPWANFEF